MNFRQSVGFGKKPWLVQVNESSSSDLEMGFGDPLLVLKDEGKALVKVKAVSREEVMRCMTDDAVLSQGRNVVVKIGDTNGVV